MLRAGSQGSQVDFAAITQGASGEVAGVDHGAELIAFADAAVARSPEVGAAREAVQKSLGDAEVVDAAAVIANFQRMVRIADGTGIPAALTDVDPVVTGEDSGGISTPPKHTASLRPSRRLPMAGSRGY